MFWSSDSRKLDALILASARIEVALAKLQTTVMEIKLENQDIQALLDKLNGTTNKMAANQQVIADAEQKISDEMDAFIAANPPGTKLSDAQVTQLQGFANSLQGISDASDGQVVLLQAIAAKGAPVVPAAPAPVVLEPAA